MNGLVGELDIASQYLRSALLSEVVSAEMRTVTAQPEETL
jgi:hypothetical protein